MVIGHAECPGFLMSFIYLFHMPIFFITAGYFFTKKCLDEPWTFVVKRFKGLYVPMVKWSIFFLLLHNVFFYFGIMNEQYGNWEGGVTHPYSVQTMIQRLVNIVFSMGGYDEFMAGAFWFFRALLLSSIVFLVLHKLIEGKVKWIKGSGVTVAIIVLAIGFGLLKTGFGLKIQTVVQGGIREVMGVIFFGVGVLISSYQDKIKNHWGLALIYLGILIFGTICKFRGMALAIEMRDVLTLTVTGTVGYLLTYHISTIIDKRDNILKKFLIYCGEMTVYIYVFHIISFKVVSLIKIWWYNLDFGQIGCHMVIHEHPGDGFWILYTIAGVGLPLGWMWVYNKIKERRLRVVSQVDTQS